MVYRQTERTSIQLGVAYANWHDNNYYKPACTSGYPSTFVRVSKYIDWINSTTSAARAHTFAQSFVNSILLTATGAVLALRNTLLF